MGDKCGFAHPTTQKDAAKLAAKLAFVRVKSAEHMTNKVKMFANKRFFATGVKLTDEHKLPSA